jgi:hypothetical protein
MAEKENVNVNVNNPDFLDFGATIGENVEKRHKFKPRPELGNLCQGTLQSVTVEMIETKSTDKNDMPSTWEYAGLKLPNLILTFKQEKTPKDPADRYFEYRVQPFTVRKKDGSESKRSDIVDFYKREFEKLQHICNAYKSEKNYNDVKIPAFNPLDEDPIARLKSVAAWFEAWAARLNGKDGKGFSTLKMWIKLIAVQDGTYLSFPGFVGEGFIEKVSTTGNMPSIELRPGETVVLVSKKDRKNANGAAASGAAEGSGDPLAGLSPELAAAVAGYSK